MMDTNLKLAIRSVIHGFSNAPLRDSAISLFSQLGYRSDRTINVESVRDFCSQFDPAGKLNHPSAMK